MQYKSPYGPFRREWLACAFFRPAVFFFAIGQCLLVATGSGAEGIKRVQPKVTDTVFGNPGMGWQTFGRFADDDKNLAGLPSTSAYFRFYWREVEPADGKIDFAKFDELLAHAKRAGQKLAFRIMCTGSGQYMDVPAWLKEQGCKGVEFKYESGTCWVPDFTDEKFQRAHSRLIRELGRRYDAHPDLDLVDIGSVGLWGEWHMSSTTDVNSGKPVALPPLEVRMAIIDEWCRAFPTASKAILIGSEEGMARAEMGGYGWRADCLGDMGGFSKTWNHMDNFYLQQLKKTRAEEVWRKAPVAFESCWTMLKWKAEGWDIRYIFDYALNCHASYLNNKSAAIPEGTRPEIERFLRRLGYRLVISSLEHQAAIKAGTSLGIDVNWKNEGVAPPYRDYRVAYRLSRRDKPAAEPILLTSTDSIRGWLPGAVRTRWSILLPGSLAQGSYSLAIGIVEPATGKPAVQLGIEGRGNDGWYTLSSVDVE
jgi:hypothetical protein